MSGRTYLYAISLGATRRSGGAAGGSGPRTPRDHRHLDVGDEAEAGPARRAPPPPEPAKAAGAPRPREGGPAVGKAPRGRRRDPLDRRRAPRLRALALEHGRSGRRARGPFRSIGGQAPRRGSGQDALAHRSRARRRLRRAPAKPKLVSRPTPAYTDDARAAGISGKVRVEITVDEQGRVVAVRLLQGLGHGLDEAAVAAARAMTFEPAVRCGRSSSATFKVGFNFSPGTP